MRLAPKRDRRLQPPGASFGQPDGTAAQVAFHHGDLDEAERLQRAQVARQGRLLEPGAAREMKATAAQAAMAELRARLRKGAVTLLYAARDEERNNAVALLLWLKGATSK